MIRTYILENKEGSVIEYFMFLNDAKRSLEHRHPTASILALKGNYFGEGFHHYRMKLVDGRFKREMLR